MNPQAQTPGIQTVQGFKLATLAFELGLITSDQMCQALVAWLPQQASSLSVLMVESGYLSESDRELLEQLAIRHSEPTSAVDDGLQPIRQHLAALTVGNSAAPALREAVQTLSRTLRESSPRKQGSATTGSSARDSATGLSAAAAAAIGDAAGTEEFVARGLTELNASSHRFRLLRPYAVGGLGVVSVAHDVELDREVAVKEIRPNATSDDAVQRFMLEARVTGQLDHPGIPPVYALGYFEDGRPFYVMRLIEGVTLKEAIAAFHSRFPSPDTSRERSLELRKLLGSLVSVCNTLRFAHSRNVLHRDIKPSNIMLGEYGETLVLDWGLAKNKEQSLPFSINDAKAHHTKRKADDPTQTGTGSVMGTPHYMSPEQARGEWESVNVRSDVYSVGATLYTLLTGRLPFSGTTRDEVREQVRQGSFTRPRQIDARVPEALDAICVKAMSLQREDRFANTGELASEIEHWLADEPVSSFRESALLRWQRWIKVRQSLVASLILLLATGFVALAAGFIAVTSQYQTVSQATVVAEQLNQLGQQHLTEARELVLSYLLVDNDKRLAMVPGTEPIRMQMINEAIRLLKQWSDAEPLNAQYQLNLAGAYRERHRVHRILHEPQAAWSDLMRSLGIVEQYLMARDLNIRSMAMNYRYSLFNDAASVIGDLGNDQSALQFAIEVRSHAAKLYERRTHDIAARVCFIEASLLLANLLIANEQVVQAAELADGAVTLLEDTSRSLEPHEVATQLIGGEFVINELIMEAHKLQALSAYELGDHDLAWHLSAQAKEELKRVGPDVPNQHHAENALTIDKVELRLALESADITPLVRSKLIDAFVVRAHQFYREFPKNHTILGLLNDSYIIRADHQLMAGLFSSTIDTACDDGTVLSLDPGVYQDKRLIWNRIRLNIRLAEAYLNLAEYETSWLFLSMAAQDVLLFPRLEQADYASELERLDAASNLVAHAILRMVPAKE